MSLVRPLPPEGAADLLIQLRFRLLILAHLNSMRVLSKRLEIFKYTGPRPMFGSRLTSNRDG